jgi:hypothetical protein
MWASDKGIGGGGDDLIGAPFEARRREAWGTNGRGVKWPGWGIAFIGLRRQGGVRSGRDSTSVSE